MFQATEYERFLLQWAVSCRIYSPSFLAVDDSFAAVWLRVLRSLDVRSMGYDHYWAALGWLAGAGKWVTPTFR